MRPTGSRYAIGLWANFKKPFGWSSAIRIVYCPRNTRKDGKNWGGVPNWHFSFPPIPFASFGVFRGPNLPFVCLSYFAGSSPLKRLSFLPRVAAGRDGHLCLRLDGALRPRRTLRGLLLRTLGQSPAIAREYA